MSRAIVTGAAGFIGQALVASLTRDGTDVVAVDVNPCPIDGARTVVADVGVPGILRPWIRADSVIYHLAAIASVPQSVAEPRVDFDNTMRPVFEVLEVARDRGARVVFPSTASVFDPSNSLPIGERGWVRPTSPYGAAKIAGEAYCFAYHRSFGVDARVVRFFSLYGPGLRRLAVYDLIRKVQAGSDRIDLLGDGRQVRDYLFIDDAVAGLRLVADCGAPGEDYNVASGEPVTLLDLARHIAAMLGRSSVPIVPTGRSFPGDTPRWYADTTKVAALGFRPQVCLEEGLRRTVAWVNAQ
jgi:UDP-glucose 4-epimerase